MASGGRIEPSTQDELNAWGELLQTAAVAAEAATVVAGKRWGGRFRVAPEIAALFKEPTEYVPEARVRKEGEGDVSVGDDEDDASSIPDLEPAEKWGQEIPEGFEEEPEDPSLLRRMALATMRCDDGFAVWDEEQVEGGGRRQGDAREEGRRSEDETAGRKRKRDEMEGDEEGWEVVVVARRMRVNVKKVQVEMSAGATMRKAEAVKGAVRSGLKPELGGNWEGRNEKLEAWEAMGRIKRNNRNKSKAGKRRTGNQKRWAKENGAGAAQQRPRQQQQQQRQQPEEQHQQRRDQRGEEGEGSAAGSERSPIRAPSPTVASTPQQQQQQQQQQRPPPPPPPPPPPTTSGSTIHRLSTSFQQQQQQE